MGRFELWLALLTALGLCACGQSSEQEKPNASPSVQPSSPESNLMAAVQKPVPRQFDFYCKIEIEKRVNANLTYDKPGKPVLLHVDLDKGLWCRDRCAKTYALQQADQYGAITLAHVDTSVINTDISISPATGGYSETYIADLPGRSGSTEYDGDCKVRKLTTLR